MSLVALPLEDLARFAGQLKPVLLERTLRASQRAAWLEWRDSGMRARFDRAGHKKYGFSKRKKSKGILPAYVHTGSFRRSLEKRKPKKVKVPGKVATSFSIFGGALNFLGQANMHGIVSETKTLQTHIVTRRAHARQTVSGAVQVSAHPMRETIRKKIWTKSPKTYRDEWEYRDFELAHVRGRADALFLERFRKTAVDKKGNIKANWRAIHPEESQE